MASTPADTDHLVTSSGSLDIAAHRGFFVYRLWDLEGNLLYVGQSTDLLGRIQGHRASSVFRHQIVHITYEQLPDKRTMDNREAALIRALQPPHNTTGVNRHTTTSLPPNTANLSAHREAKTRAKDLGITKAQVARAQANTVETG